jgi:hypothetical protein
MTHPLSRVPLLGKFVDERFLEHRRRSTSVAGLAGALLAAALFEYRLVHDHVISWDLLSVVGLMVVVKMSMMVWFRFND